MSSPTFRDIFNIWQAVKLLHIVVAGKRYILFLCFYLCVFYFTYTVHINSLSFNMCINSCIQTFQTFDTNYTIVFDENCLIEDHTQRSFPNSRGLPNLFYYHTTLLCMKKFVRPIQPCVNNSNNFILLHLSW